MPGHLLRSFEFSSRVTESRAGAINDFVDLCIPAIQTTLSAALRQRLQVHGRAEGEEVRRREARRRGQAEGEEARGGEEVKEGEEVGEEQVKEGEAQAALIDSIIEQ